MDYGLEYDLLDDQPTAFSRWIVPALIISVLLHILLFIWLSSQHFQLFAPVAQEKPLPKPFTLKAVTIDPKVFQPQQAEKKQATAAPQAVKLPQDKPSLSAMMSENKGTPAAPKIDNPMLAEKPKIDATSYAQTVQNAEDGGVKSVAKDLDQVRQDMLTEKPGVSGKPLLDLAKPDTDSGGSPATKGALAGGSTPGFSNLDDLLAQTGPLTKETAPIRMDSDVLYGYNSYELQPSAIESLQKLGVIIQRNPQLVFSIEGHSDSSGSQQYNLQLSQQRAEAVKAWLLQNMNIDPARIVTFGFGSTKPIVAATEPFDEVKEAPNRRVEIVLHDRSPSPSQ
ncbi:MAG TPA: OmpA family protein [Chthoniobacterales bacterium]|nr:OmpA family protein [Chthoniobacterales bacterium]